MTEATSRPISRRTVAKGAAWTAPVILGGVAAPAYASSGSKPTASAGPACKLPGASCLSEAGIKWGYAFVFTVTNTSDKTIWLYAESGYAPVITNNLGSPTGILLTYAGGYVGSVKYGVNDNIKVPVAPGNTVTFNLALDAHGNSENLSGTITIQFQWGHKEHAADDREHEGDPVIVNVAVPSTKPCKTCYPADGLDTKAAKEQATQNEAAPEAPAQALPSTSSPSTSSTPDTSTPHTSSTRLQPEPEATAE